MKIHKTTKKEYYGERMPDGSVVFSKPTPDNVPFKCVTTYGADGKPVEENWYNSDRNLFSHWEAKPPYQTWSNSDYYIDEIQHDNNGNKVYVRREVHPDKADKYWMQSEEAFLEYRERLLYKVEIISQMSAAMTDFNGCTEPLIKRTVQFYNEKGDCIKSLRYKVNSNELSGEDSYSYRYDQYGNMIYEEQQGFMFDGPFQGEPFFKRTYITIKYQEEQLSAHSEPEDEDTTPF